VRKFLWLTNQNEDIQLKEKAKEEQASSFPCQVFLHAQIVNQQLCLTPHAVYVVTIKDKKLHLCKTL